MSGYYGGTGTPAGSGGFPGPNRTPTNSSYYDFHGNPANNKQANSPDWMYARDARSQQAGVPAGSGSKYPSYYGNKPPLPLSTAPGLVPWPNGKRKPTVGYLHHPLIPGQQTTYVPGTGPPGAVRSAYPPGDPNNFDVMYHDPKKQGDFSLATYHPRSPNK